MSANSSSSPAVPAGASLSVPPEEIDASCRVPVLFLFVCAAFWLVFASLLSLAASLKFHMPAFLADCPWLTYGRVQPAAANALVYGFAIQASLGVALWLVARLGRTALILPGLATIGAVIWNAGMKLGMLAIFAGDSTGFELLEMPGYVSPILFVAYAVIGVSALLTFIQRREPGLYVSQWFLLAALFWFPWIYSTANMLLVFVPVRGVMQAVVNWWFVGNLTNIWFGFIGLAAIFYFIPRLTGRPLHSRYQAMFAFWTLALFGSWGNVPHSAPLPSWLPGLSTVFAVFTLLPLVAVGLNLWHTLGGRLAAAKGEVSLRLLVISAAAYLVAGALSAVSSLDKVNELLCFTFFVPALKQLFLYGFVGLGLFGAIYHIVPQLTSSGFPSPRLVKLNVVCAIVGLVLCVFPLAIGGVVQGIALNDANVPFMDTLKPALMFFRLSTLGDLALLLASGALLINLFWLLTRCCRACCVPALVAAVKPEAVGAVR